MIYPLAALYALSSALGHEGWVTRDHKLTIGGWDWLYTHSDVLIRAIGNDGEVASIPTQVEIVNGGSHDVYFSCQRSGDIELPVKAGQTVRRRLQGLAYTKGKPMGVEEVEVTVKVWAVGIRTQEIEESRPTAPHPIAPKTPVQNAPARTESNFSPHRSEPTAPNRSEPLPASINQMAQARAADEDELNAAKDEAVKAVRKYWNHSRARELVRIEYQSGSFCSQCNRSASEIEAADHTTFDQHLLEVHGHRVPATPQQLDEKMKAYDAETDADHDAMWAAQRRVKALEDHVASSTAAVEQAFKQRAKASEASGSSGRADRMRRISEGN